jgi:hypothetical protein
MAGAGLEVRGNLSPLGDEEPQQEVQKQRTTHTAEEENDESQANEPERPGQRVGNAGGYAAKPGGAAIKPTKGLAIHNGAPGMEKRTNSLYRDNRD